MQYAVSNIAWSYDDRLLAYEQLAINHISGLEVAPGLLFFLSDNPFKPSLNDLCRAKAEVADFGLTLVSMQSLHYGTPNAQLFGDNDEQKLFLTALANNIELAEQLEIPNMVLGSPKQRIKPKAMDDSIAFERAIEALTPIADKALSAGVNLSVESNPAVYGTNFLTRPEETLQFVQNFDHTAITLNFDIGAVHITGLFPEIEKLIKDAASKIGHVHMSEPFLKKAPANPAQAAHVLKILNEVEYKRSVSIEMRQSENSLTNLSFSLQNLKKARTVFGSAV